MEGPKDAAMMFQCGLWAVALMGHVITPWQAQRLEGLSHRKILCLDNDATRVSMKLERKTGWEAAYLPDGDPADYRDNLAKAAAEHRDLPSKVAQLLKNKQIK